MRALVEYSILPSGLVSVIFRQLGEEIMNETISVVVTAAEPGEASGKSA